MVADVILDMTKEKIHEINRDNYFNDCLHYYTGSCNNFDIMNMSEESLLNVTQTIFTKRPLKRLNALKNAAQTCLNFNNSMINNFNNPIFNKNLNINLRQLQNFDNFNKNQVSFNCFNPITVPMF